MPPEGKTAPWGHVCGGRRGLSSPPMEQEGGETSPNPATSWETCRAGDRAEPQQHSERQKPLSAGAGGSHACTRTCTGLITNTARCCPNAACKASRWKKRPTTLSNTTVTLARSGDPKQSCPSNQKTTSNPPNTCCNSSALNKALRNTQAQSSGQFLLHSGGHHAPAVVHVPCPWRGTVRGGTEPLWDHRAAWGLCFLHGEDARAGAQPGIPVGSHSHQDLLMGGSHLKLLLAKLGASRRDASYPKSLPIRLRKSLLQGRGRKQVAPGRAKINLRNKGH